MHEVWLLYLTVTLDVKSLIRYTLTSFVAVVGGAAAGLATARRRTRCPMVMFGCAMDEMQIWSVVGPVVWCDVVVWW